MLAIRFPLLSLYFLKSLVNQVHILASLFFSTWRTPHEVTGLALRSLKRQVSASVKCVGSVRHVPM